MAGVVAGVVAPVVVPVFPELVDTASLPNWAKGFGLPSLPSGVSVILESRKLLNATSDKIELSSFILLTLNSNERKSSAVIEVTPSVLGVEPSALGEVAGADETRLACSPDDFIKKI